MKKLFISCAMLVCSSALFAKGDSKIDLDFGAKVGYTTSIGFNNLSAVKDYTWQTAKDEFGNGFHVGLFARIGGRFYVQPELLYNYQKTNYEVSFSDVLSGDAFDANKYVTSSTLDIPILAAYRLFDLKVIDMRVLLGPKIRINAGSKIEYRDKSTQEVVSQVSDVLRAANVGLETGIGFEIINRLNLDVRYNLISNISKDVKWKQNDENIEAANFKKPLSTFVISLGFRIF